MGFRISSSALLVFGLINHIATHAAEPINLRDTNLETFKRFSVSSDTKQIEIQELRRDFDTHKNLHVKMQQYYKNYPIFGADGILHIPSSSQSADIEVKQLITNSSAKKSYMNGIFYRGLEEDLKTSPEKIFTTAVEKNVIQMVIAAYEEKSKQKIDIVKQEAQPFVYIDDSHIAHWVYKVSIYGNVRHLPTKPTALIDAENFKVYAEWNEVMHLDAVEGGGYGGNKKTGRYSYDGKDNHFSKLQMVRDNAKKICYLANPEVAVFDFRANAVSQFSCPSTDLYHNELYWSGNLNEIHGGYSPDNDALFVGQVIQDLYKTWYHIPALVNYKHEAMRLDMIVHSPNYDEDGRPDPDNALWDSEQQKMFFGDGQSYFYPLTSIGVGGHEVSHGFTQQHSNLYYFSQSGGMNEAFSDMAAQAAEYFATGTNSWMIGAEITLKLNTALRYLDHPTKDCAGRKPGDHCSIDHIRDFTSKVNVHYSSGIYNRVFYLLATAPNWDVHKAFDVIVQANRYHWTKFSSFTEGACGVLRAAKELDYHTGAITRAFAEVGINTGRC